MPSDNGLQGCAPGLPLHDAGGISSCGPYTLKFCTETALSSAAASLNMQPGSQEHLLHAWLALPRWFDEHELP